MEVLTLALSVASLVLALLAVRFCRRAARMWGARALQAELRAGGWENADAEEWDDLLDEWETMHALLDAVHAGEVTPEDIPAMREELGL